MVYNEFRQVHLGSGKCADGTSQTTLLGVAHGGTMVVPSVAHTLQDWLMNRPASSQLAVSGPSCSGARTQL